MKHKQKIEVGACTGNMNMGAAEGDMTDVCVNFAMHRQESSYF